MAVIDNFKQLKTDIQERRNIATSIGSAVGDTFINPVAHALDREDVLAEFVTRLQSLDSLVNIEIDTSFFTLLVDALRSTPDDVSLGIRVFLDKIATQYNLNRKLANFATGFVQFTRQSAPTVDITISAGTVVFSTITGQRYVTTESRTMTVVDASSFFNSDLNLFVLTVPIQSQASGVAGNIPDQLIDSSEVALTGITSIFNTAAIVNGSNDETNASLAGRIKLALQSQNLGSIEGYRRMILEGSSNVTDVYVAGQGDPIMIRDLGDGGAVDIYILERNLVTVTEIVNDLSSSHVLSQQPAKSITSVTPSVGTFPPGTVNGFVEDITSGYAFSVRSQSSINWLTGPTAPYTVTYQIDNNVITLQNFVLQPENKFLGADVLIKEATQVNIDIFMTIKVLNGFIVSTVVGQVILDLTAFISLLHLGDSLQQSDLIKVTVEVPGVDQVLLPLTKFNRTELTGIQDTISVGGNEFIRLANITVGATA